MSGVPLKVSPNAHSPCCLVVAVVWVVGVAPVAPAQPARQLPIREQQQKLDEAIRKKLVPVEAVFDEISKLAEPAAGDDAHRALLRERLEVARRAALNRVILFKAGSARGTILDLVDSIERLA